MASPLFFMTVFLSAFLLFQVQPLISRYILPWFGGSPAVWTTCMLFFQVTLFAGYVYAHLLVGRLQPRTQAVLHVALIGLAASLLPIVPSPVWKPTSAGDPSTRIILLLAATVGLPYFVLSTTGPLLQGWYLKASGGRSPWRLYALSNVGSLLALITYPFLFEPQFTTGLQARMWSWAFYAFAAGCAVCSLFGLSGQRDVEAAADADHETSGETPAATEHFSTPAAAAKTPPGSSVILWAALAAVPTVMLLATTNQVCTDIAVIPFLWVLPLSLYLLSFILCFDSDRWYRRRFWLPLLTCFIAGATFLLGQSAGLWRFPAIMPVTDTIIVQAGTCFGLMFAACMVCHGELVRVKPAPEHLTLFYLSMSAGGAMGGLFVGLVAPQLFDTLLELPVGIVAVCVLMILTLWHQRESLPPGLRSPAWAMIALLAVGGLSWVFKLQNDYVTRSTLAIARNFYGVVRVDRQNDAWVLRHGQIRHGHQFADAERRLLPTTYYGYQSGAGLALKQHRPDPQQRVGVIGLGAGTLATYAQPGDYYRMYEINPAVIDMARDFFTYLSDCKGEVDVIAGDARIQLEREEPQQFDVLVLDAFSGDAIPMHLLTRECCELYLKHLKHNGVLAFHITNRHVDLKPICNGLAAEFGLAIRGTVAFQNRELGTESTLWVLMSRKPESLSNIEYGKTATIHMESRSILWTDDWSNLLAVLGGAERVRILDDDTNAAASDENLAQTE